MQLEQVPIATLPPERFRAVLGERYVEVERAIDRAQRLLEGRAVWHINSTATGGGVAELLHSLLAYARGAGVDVRWSVIVADAEFFRITKGLHNDLHGVDGAAAGPSAAERATYKRVADANADALAQLVRPGDIVYLHDPQTAGMTARMVEAGALTIWRCHIGADRPTGRVRAAWSFLLPLVAPAHKFVFSRSEYVWDGLDPSRVALIPPSIDAFSAKNEELSERAVAAILDRIGLASDGGEPAVFHRQDGSAGRVDRRAELEQDAPLPSDAPLLTQVSRWDRLKDPLGVLEGFARHVRCSRAHLALVGPIADGVADDPQGATVYRQVREARAGLEPGKRARVHLVSLPMDDVEENAAMVNAIQRRSTVVVQKSLAEGFGLTATEAMWKSKPVIASAVGGLGEQVLDGVTGRLIDPADLAGFGRAADELLASPELAQRFGAAGKERVREHFLGTRHLIAYVDLLSGMLD